MKPLVVCGDAMLDRDIDGTATRLAPDAPVPVVDGLVESRRPGGAALAAALARRFAAHVVLVTALGDDDTGAEIRDLLDQADVEVQAFRLEGPTASKTRVRASGHPLVRLDVPSSVGTIDMASMDPAALIVGASAVLVADYGRGVASLTGVREALARRGAAARVVWDPHPHGPHPVEGTHLTPNESEASALLRSAGLRTSTEPADLAQALCRRFACASVALTRGAAGSLYTTGDGPPLSLPPERPVSGDCCGAGDAFAAALTAALAGGLLPREAAQHAVTEAGRYVAAGGPANWSPTAAHRARRSDPAVMSGRMRSPLGGGAVVVATSGCFDLLHAGHVEMLRAARDLGDRLVVLLNSDASVRRLKGHGRPVQSAVDRARILASLRSVDDVWIFDEDDPVASLRKLRPDIFVKGGDYAYHDLVEARAVGEWGGTVRILPYSDGRSTTSIIEHARATGFAT